MGSPALDPVWVCERIDQLIGEFKEQVRIYTNVKRTADEARVRYDAKVESWTYAVEQLEDFKRRILSDD